MKCDRAIIELILMGIVDICVIIALFYEFYRLRREVKKINSKVRDINDDLNDLEEFYNDGNDKKTNN